MIQIRVSPKGKSRPPKYPIKNKGTGVAAAKQDYPLSTNVSSPIQAASRRRRIAPYSKSDSNVKLKPKGYSSDAFVISDNDAISSNAVDEDSDECFEPVREAGKSRSSKKKELGPPIMADEKLEKLNPTHRLVVDDFMCQAKKESENVCLNRGVLLGFPADCFQILMHKNLRSHPFTDTVLREMAINFCKGK